MANLIIKPTSGGSLILQDEGGDTALTVGTTGSTTLAGTANNLGTVTAGTISTGATIATGVHGKYVLEEQTGYVYEAQTVTTTTGLHEHNISGSNYATVAVGSNVNDMFEFLMDFGMCQVHCSSTAGYLGFGMMRATNTGFSTGTATLWRSGEHAFGGGAGSANDTYDVNYFTKIATATECGFSASTTYYVRLTGMSHTSSGSFKWGGSNFTDSEGTIEPDGIRLTVRRWRLL